MVRTAADMTVRQIISLLFDRVADELGVTANSAAQTAAVVVAGESNMSVGVNDSEGAEEAVVEEEEEEGEGGRGGGAGEGALRCAHLVFQVKGEPCLVALDEIRLD